MDMSRQGSKSPLHPLYSPSDQGHSHRGSRGRGRRNSQVMKSTDGSSAILDMQDRVEALALGLRQVAADRSRLLEVRTDRPQPSRAIRLLRRLFPRLRLMADAAEIRASGLFDARWYRSRDPELDRIGADPAVHYLRHGADEGRDPGPDFSTMHYLSRSPDVAQSGLNPLLHYLRAGRAEGREPRPPRAREALILSGPTPGPSWRLPRRLAYVVSHSRPYSSNGYAVRTHAVARALVRRGHDVLVFNRPGRPWDIEGFDLRRPVPLEEWIDGVRYLFLPSPTTRATPGSERRHLAETILSEAFALYRPAAVMAASNWETGEPALGAARRLGLPFFWEQRGFWEMFDPNVPGLSESAEGQQARDRELRLARAAEAVFTLNGAMRDELVRRGVTETRIHLVPNGIEERPARIMGPDRNALGCGTAHLLGYIGSLSAYEGVEDLIRLVARLRADGLDVGALIVGSDAPKGLHAEPGRKDAGSARLARLAEDLGVAGWIRFVPQVPADEVAAYYRAIDVLVLPRRRTPVTEIVAPIKPYAAAAHGVPVIMTDLPPLAEIAAEIGATVFPEGDLDVLAKITREIVTAPQSVDRTPPVLSEALSWSSRVRPISRRLTAIASDEDRRNAALLSQHDLSGMSEADFDIRRLPEVFLSAGAAARRAGPVVALGPASAWTARDDAEVVRPNRATLLGDLATADPGTFLIDWIGLRAAPDPEWAGLWSITDMQLNRQIMDAVRIARTRGWNLQVTGPVARSEAPLFRTVAAVFQEIDPEKPSLGFDGGGAP